MRQRKHARTALSLASTLAMTCTLLLTGFGASAADTAVGFDIKPVAKYAFEDADNPGKDSMGNYDLRKGGTGAITQFDGAVGKGVYFDGASWLEYTDTDDFTDDFTDYTIMFYARREAADQDQPIVVGTGWRDKGGVTAQLSNGDYFCTGAHTTEAANPEGWYWTQFDGQKTTGALHHYAVSVTGGGRTMTHYLDGEIIKSVTLENGTFIMKNEDYTFTIGGLSNAAGWCSYPVKGWVDEVTVYDTGLSAAQVKRVYKGKSLADPIAKYSFEDAENPGKDTMGNYDLAAKGTGAITQFDGAVGKGVYFDGASWLEYTDTDDFTDDFTDYTIAFYARRDGEAESAEDQAIVVGTGWRDKGGVAVHLNKTDWFCAGGRSSTDGEIWAFYDMGAGKTTGEIHHYAVTVSGGGKVLTQYVDGAAVATKTLETGNFLMNNGDYTFTIGGLANTADWCSYPLTGWVDEVVVYDYALDTAGVKALLSDGKPIEDGPVTGDPLPLCAVAAALVSAGCLMAVKPRGSCRKSGD